MILLFNGQAMDSKEAVISALDHGFLYGMGLFETFRTYNGVPWLLERHVNRLKNGCELLGITYAPDIQRIKETVAQALKANELSDGYIRFSVSAGEGAIGLPSDAYDQPNEIVYAKELAVDTPATRKGKTLRLLKLRRSTPEGAVRLKSFHYMNNIMAKQELTRSGAGLGTEGLFLDNHGHVAEGMVSNVFWVKDGILHTPAAETGLLEGITREYVLEQAVKLGLVTQQGLYTWEELLGADEVFVTNSIQEIVPVVRLEDEQGLRHQSEKSDKEGTITRLLMTKYREAAERNDL
jgi:4-amino-4-deoxychorismate lyase